MNGGEGKLGALLVLTLLAACGGGGAGSQGDPTGGGVGAVTDSGAGAPEGGAGGSSSSGGPGVDGGGRPPTDGGGGDGTGVDGASGGVRDPNVDGPFAFAEKDATTTVSASGDRVAIHAAYPTAAGKYPVVVFAHGFQLSPTLYYGYLKRLATFGYVALTVDFPTSFLGNDNPKEAKDLSGGLEWAKADATLGPITDAANAGMSGHSLGGKLALLAAVGDARVKAALVLDPVDGGGGSCSAPSCVLVADLVGGLHIPTGFLGETLDASGSFQACAPANANFTTFYAKTLSPSFAVTVTGANHMSFLDDVGACGATCSFCNAASAPNAQVNGMGKAYVVAFYERWLRGNAAYDAYLTGAQAQARYVATNQATIASR